MLHTTFRLAKAAGACVEEYAKVERALGGAKHYGYDNPIPLTVVLEHTSIESAIWALRCVLPGEEAERDRIARLFACSCAEGVLHLFERGHPNDPRPGKAIGVSRRFAAGEATKEELVAARAAAWDAAWDAAGAAARAAARAAAWDAARDAANAAAWDAARDAANAAAWDAAWAAANAAQIDIFLRLLSGKAASEPPAFPPADLPTREG
jgi:hypothetical protein